jgi:poly-gamma-glutamate capsule biosynthesis protein CapA/YwtB (metallophosphatase superfamily)
MMELKSIGDLNELLQRMQKYDHGGAIQGLTDTVMGLQQAMADILEMMSEQAPAQAKAIAEALGKVKIAAPEVTPQITLKPEVTVQRPNGITLEVLDRDFRGMPTKYRLTFD